MQCNHARELEKEMGLWQRSLKPLSLGLHSTCLDRVCMMTPIGTNSALDSVAKMEPRMWSWDFGCSTPL